MEEKLKDFFAHQFEEDLIKEIIDIGEVKMYREGDLLLKVGDDVNFFPLVLRWVFKILSEDDAGNEVVMYFL